MSYRSQCSWKHCSWRRCSWRHCSWRRCSWRHCHCLDGGSRTEGEQNGGEERFHPNSWWAKEFCCNDKHPGGPTEDDFIVLSFYIQITGYLVNPHWLNTVLKDDINLDRHTMSTTAVAPDCSFLILKSGSYTTRLSPDSTSTCTLHRILNTKLKFLFEIIYWCKVRYDNFPAMYDTLAEN